MREREICQLIEAIQKHELSKDQAYQILKDYPFKDIGCAKVDTQRESRTGYPEVIFGQGKSPGEILSITKCMAEVGQNILITRTNREVYELLKERLGDISISYNDRGHTISILLTEPEETDSMIAIVSAGTADNGVVEEAYETARILGNRVEKITDVGVAGIHRLFANLDRIRQAKVIIAVAGMEGALPSVVAGLGGAPGFVLPPSGGYGGELGGGSGPFGVVYFFGKGNFFVEIEKGFWGGYNVCLIKQL